MHDDVIYDVIIISKDLYTIYFAGIMLKKDNPIKSSIGK